MPKQKALPFPAGPGWIPFLPLPWLSRVFHPIFLCVSHPCSQQCCAFTRLKHFHPFCIDVPLPVFHPVASWIPERANSICGWLARCTECNSTAKQVTSNHPVIVLNTPSRQKYRQRSVVSVFHIHPLRYIKIKTILRLKLRVFFTFF